MQRIALVLLTLASMLGFAATAHAGTVPCHGNGYYTTYPCAQQPWAHGHRRQHGGEIVIHRRYVVRHHYASRSGCGTCGVRRNPCGACGVRRNPCGACNGPVSTYRAPTGPIATPRNEAYRPAAVAEVRAGIKYTGKACTRADGSVGAEGFGVDGQLGCWRF